MPVQTLTLIKFNVLAPANIYSSPHHHYEQQIGKPKSAVISIILHVLNKSLSISWAVAILAHLPEQYETLTFLHYYARYIHQHKRQNVGR